MKIALWIIVLSGMIFWYGCENNPADSGEILKLKLPGAFIMNEGDFGQSNGSISFYSFVDSKIQNDVFRKANNRDLGDIVQSMTIHGSTGYIVVNNSNKIEVVDIQTCKSLAVIEFTGGESPRHMAVAGSEKAYVTNLYTQSVSIIDLADNIVTGTISVGLNPDAILRAGEKVYVANSGFGYDHTVSIIDINSDRVVGSIPVGDYPADMDLDGEGRLHILCSGLSDWSNSANDTQAGIYIVDPESDAVIDSLILSGHPSKLSLDGRSRGFFIDGFYGNVVSYSTTDNQMENGIFFPGTFYGLETDPENDRLFLLDPKSFTQSGELKIVDREGQVLETHTVGKGPSHITFVYEGNPAG